MGTSLAVAAAALALAGSALLAATAAAVAPASVAPPTVVSQPAEDPGPASDGRPTPAPSHGYEWPTGGPVEVARAFDAPEARWGAGHRGVDLRAPAGAPVMAAADGVVAFAGRVAGRPVVSVDHPDGIRTTYEPVAPEVAIGESVRSGDVLGRLEEGTSSHCAPRACLHWGARRGADQYLDPLDLVMADVVIRLYPAD